MKNLRLDFIPIKLDKLICLIIFLNLCFFHTTALGRIRIDIYGPEFIPFPIAIAPFSSNDSTKDIAAQARSILINDLNISGFFKVSGEEAFPPGSMKALENPDSIDLQYWTGKPYDALVTGGAALGGDGLTTYFRLFDLIERSFVTGLRYTAPLDDIRKISHKMADEIIFHLTGQLGISHTKIAFISKRGGIKEVYIIDFDGHGITRLTNHDSICLSPAWSPDGKKIAYTCFKKRNPNLYIYDIKNKTFNIISSRVGVNGAPAWSPDGNKLAIMTRREDRTKIAIITLLRKGDPLFLTPSGPGNEASPTWSPDGQKLAFLSDRSGNPQIYTIDSTGKNLTRITFKGSYNASPAWSPLGDRIAFCSMVDGHFDIFTCNPDGKDLRRLTQDGYNNESPTWSPDGRFIVFSSDRFGTSQIYCMNNNGANVRQITFSNFQGQEPAWSPYLL